ncbi:DUF4097 family beta strand repeat-containing protein [Ornithinimicrobium humiphilum]|uniref:Putative adhesin n=1 Tax=Ornithinimicrobium humiphilum TaxID=125288 RepID=A0A543KRE5_9MICO|nr:DUF4097 family beta strand repeat-containing protein [Ornithinimicrobium humiphilum]TQM97647.1 putative adhesin [Ornithinimicrobium humiphilum]
MDQITATTLSRSFADDAPISLQLTNHRGDVEILTDAAPGTATVELQADREVDLSAVDLRCRGGVLTVDVPALEDPAGSRGFSFSLGPLHFSAGDDGVTVDVVVHVPEGADVEARTKSGDITVAGPSGATRLSTGSGDLRAEDCGEVRLSTGSGDVSLGACPAGSVTTGSGDVRIDHCSGPGTLQVRTGSGDVEVRSAAEETIAATGSGDIELDLRSGRATLRTGTGDVEVRVPRGIPVWLDLNTGLGDVETHLDPVGAPEPGQDHLSVSVRSGTGDVRVTH